MKKVITSSCDRKHTERPTSSSPPPSKADKADKIATLKRKVTTSWRRKDPKKPKDHSPASSKEDELATLKRNFVREMKVINERLAYLEEITNEVEKKAGLVVTFLDRVGSAIEKALLNPNLGPATDEHSSECRMIDFYLKKVEDHLESDRVFWTYVLNQSKFWADKWHKNTIDEIEKLHAHLEKSHMEEKIRKEAEKELRKLESRRDQAKEKVGRIDALIEEYEAARKVILFERTGTTHPEVLACKKADDLVNDVTDDNWYSDTGTDARKRVRELHGDVKNMKDKHEKVTKVAKEIQGKWTVAEKKRKIDALRALEKEMKEVVDKYQKRG